jgi:mannose-6-phosphate isomerase
MPEFFKLRNQVKHYEWGSPRWIPRLLQAADEDGRPWAELWMGSHPGAPSLAGAGSGAISLGELIAGDPVWCLGSKGAERYGELPFLFKLLAAEKPLSIQAHPNLAQAREGFARENRAGLAADAPNRNYRDANHKPEIICALTPFTGMCGFREPREILRMLTALAAPAPVSLREGLAPLLSSLQEPESRDADGAAPANTHALRNFFAALFGLSAPARTELTAYILGAAGGAGDAETGGGLSPLQWELMGRFAELYGGDPALIAPLYLNVFSLRPGEAVFLKAGVLHAYVHGFGIELMANSDNVLRGGLTPKHVDVPELMKVLDFSPHRPAILPAPSANTGGIPACVTYPAPCDEFSLSVMRGTGEEAAFAPAGPAICVVTRGAALITGEQDEARLSQGESVFIPAGAPGKIPPRFRGNYTIYAAALPAQS